ncbi:hypothetical protein [Actinomyces minihominis]|uniref:hypothetical protein n=1 Tax=Actinomyces minihominis TaxID=2002838 RepID=UPI001F5D1648|nr:hypothetical protein [Actinomyces minihominis]
MKCSVPGVTWALDIINQKRGLLPPPQSSSELDVIDPFRQSKAIYKHSRDELVPAAQVTADFLKAICSMFDVTSHETATAHHHSIQSDEAGSADVIPFPSRALVRRQEAKRRGDRPMRLFVPRRSKIAVGEAL